MEQKINWSLLKKIELVKGFRDILKPESMKRTKIKEIIEKTFRTYGFVPIETPIIEYEEVVRGNNLQDEAVSNIFKLKDKGQRDLALRYEFTFQLARLLKENPNIKLPFRRYQIGSVFRDEPTGPGRYREFSQCDIDIIGDPSVKSDAEILAVVNEVYNKLGIKIKIFVNNRKLLNSLLEKLKVEKKERDQILREIDKLEKQGEREVRKNLTELIGKEKTDNILTFLKKKLDFFLEEKYEGAEDIKELIYLCKVYGFEPEFRSSLIRGLSYYTGNVFEIFNENGKLSLAGGGRYDETVGRYIGKDIPATGLAFGLDRTCEVANIEIPKLKCLIISINQEKESIKIAQELREKEISCFIMDKISKGLDYADKEKIPFVLFLGSEEIKKKKIKIRDMKTGKENLLTSKQLLDFLKN